MTWVSSFPRRRCSTGRTGWAKNRRCREFGRSATPGIALPAYKLRYGLRMQTTLAKDGQKTTKAVTEAVYEGRQEAARSFKSIFGKRGEGEGQKNEIVITPRKRRGPFPVYASREGNELKCYEIVNNKASRRGDSLTKRSHPWGR